MGLLLTSNIRCMHQSERIQCIRYLNELHYKNVELVKGLFYGLYIISWIGMLCQVIYLLPHLWYVTVLWTFNLKNLIWEMPAPSEQWFAVENGSTQFSAFNQVLCIILSPWKQVIRKLGDYASSSLGVDSGLFCAWAAADQRGWADWLLNR